jgi:hypothetical protein
MTSNTLCNVKHKSSAYNGEYSLCDICEFNGFTNEEVVFVIHGFRDEKEDGFAIIFTAYEFPVRNGKIHSHKYNEQIVNNLVNQSLTSVEASL